MKKRSLFFLSALCLILSSCKGIVKKEISLSGIFTAGIFYPAAVTVNGASFEAEIGFEENGDLVLLSKGYPLDGLIIRANENETLYEFRDFSVPVTERRSVAASLCSAIRYLRDQTASLDNRVNLEGSEAALFEGVTEDGGIRFVFGDDLSPRLIELAGNNHQIRTVFHR